MVATCVLAMLGLAACEDDSDGQKDGAQRPPSTEGIYSPEVRVNYVTFDDGSVPQLWEWNEGQLEAVSYSDNCGGATEGIVFTYAKDRVISVTENMEGQRTETRYTYDSDYYVTNVTMSAGGVQLLGLDVKHNKSGRISHIDATVSAEYLSTLMGMLMNGLSVKFSRTPLARLVSPQVAEIIVRAAGRRPGSKLTLNGTSVQLDLQWEGDNVSRIIVNAEIDAAATMDDISQFVDLGEEAAQIGMLQGEHPLMVSVRDTMDLYYDNHVNPLKGYLGTIALSMLSANNNTALNNHGIADINLLLNGQYPVTRSMPLSQFEESIYTYTAEGYPENVTDNNGKTSTYHYVQ